MLGSCFKYAVFVASVVYALSLVQLLLKKNEADVHAALNVVDPSLTAPIAVTNLAAECGINNIKVALFDVHVLSHFVGWFVATLTLRDITLSWVCGFVWEIIEGSLEHNVTELKECWWDKVFMDLWGCNNLGIFLAWLTMRYFKIEEFNWAKVATPDGSPLHEMGFLYFIPGRNTIQQNCYGVLKSRSTCLTFIYVNMTIIFYQVNLFFLKTVFWLPTVHWIVSCRCILLSTIFILASPGLYKRGEITGFLLLENILYGLEGLLVIRFGTSLLFTGKGDMLVSMLVILSLLSFIIFALVGITQLCKSQLSAMFKPCNREKVQ